MAKPPQAFDLAVEAQAFLQRDLPWHRHPSLDIA
jgi:hypothetical protein